MFFYIRFFNFEKIIKLILVSCSGGRSKTICCQTLPAAPDKSDVGVNFSQGKFSASTDQL